MSGAWINCLGSEKLPNSKTIPVWAKNRLPQHQPANYGACSVCHKAVAVRKDGTIRVHVNTPEAKQIREKVKAQSNERAVSDLLALRKELTDPG